MDLDRLIDVEVDRDKDLITLVLDKRKKPAYICTQESLIAAAHMDRLAGRVIAQA